MIKTKATTFQSESRITKMIDTNRLYYAAKQKGRMAHANSIVEQVQHSRIESQLRCALLFWCEGSKDMANGVRFINSDPNLIATFLTLFRESFILDETKFRAVVHLHEYHDPHKQLFYWSQVARIPISQFHKPYIKPHTSKNTHPGYPGCVSLRYNDNSIAKLLKLLYEQFRKSL